MMSPRIAISGKKYSKKPVPVMTVGGPSTLAGNSFGGIVSRSSHIVSGSGTIDN